MRKQLQALVVGALCLVLCPAGLTLAVAVEPTATPGVADITTPAQGKAPEPAPAPKPDGSTTGTTVERPPLPDPEPQGEAPPTPTPTPLAFDLAGYFLLDGQGGVFAYGTATLNENVGRVASIGFGFDIARDLELTVFQTKGNTFGSVILDGFGTLWPVNTSIPATGHFVGADVMRDLAIVGNDDGAVVLRDDGVVTGSGSNGADVAAIVMGATPLNLPGAGGPDGTIRAQSELRPGPNFIAVFNPGVPSAVALQVTDNETGVYILDAYGIIHPFGSAQLLLADPETEDATGRAPGFPPFGWDIARDLELTASGNGYFVLDGYGAVHPFGDAVTRVSDADRRSLPYFGFDLARDIQNSIRVQLSDKTERAVTTPNGVATPPGGVIMLDGYGTVWSTDHTDGESGPDAPLPGTRAERVYFGWDIAAKIAVTGPAPGGNGSE